MKQYIYEKDELCEAAVRLIQKIRKIDIKNLCIDEEYKNRFLMPKVSEVDYWIGQKYLQHIKWAVSMESSKDVPLKDMTLVDHGGGTGFLGLLAKEAGIGTVIYNDIDPKFLDTAREFGRAIGVVHDDFVLGGFDELTRSLSNRKVRCTLLVSADVIEHIYDIDEFIKKLSLLSDGPMGVVMSSGANFLNPRFVFTIALVQIKAERKWCKIREGIIRTAVPDVRDHDLYVLAKKTRGLMNDEIVAVAKHYANTGSLKKIIKPIGGFDPYYTNTCDPHTGWWAEHMLNPFAFARTLGDLGFNSKVLLGDYNDGQSNSLKRFTARTLNGCIKRLNIIATPIAPYYVVIGSKT
jgi:2-polyprenyl-3-methyl-5-hydroxy-6-metoxy-1,4-benzoquinol methylase